MGEIVMRRLGVLGVLGALAAMLIVGCSDNPPRRSETVSGGAGSDTSRAPGGSPSSGTADGTDATLTQRQAEAALLTAADLPTGWSVERKKPEEDQDKVRPARCDALFAQADEGGTPAAEAEAEYSSGGFGPIVSHTVTSEDKSMAEGLGLLLHALDSCPTFTSISAEDGSKTKFSVLPLSFPSFGERSVALRMTGTAQGFNVVVDVVFIAEGHAGITIVAGGLTPLPAKQFKAFAKKAVDSLHAAADK
jgi:hypothetical protein